MKCPTCRFAVEGCCCSCGVEIPAGEQRLEEDPYASEIHHDERLHLQCKVCYHESCMDI
jgi:hypothetical protein